MCLSVQSEEISSYVTITPPPNWVTVNDVPELAAPAASGAPVHYLLADTQHRLTSETQAYFTRHARRLNTPRAVEDHSTVTIIFDPSFETVRLHRLALLRDGTEIDLLNLENFKMYRKETERDRLIYNGVLELASFAPGIRPGDVLEYSYTIDGRNPALGANFGFSLQHAYGVPVAHRFDRVSVADDLAVYLRPRMGASEPIQTSAVDGFVDYVWEDRNTPVVTADEDAPDSYNAYSRTQVSSFETWKDVGSFFASAYDASKFQSAEVIEIAERIRSQTNSEKEQIREALRFVHENVRYLGIELGAGGYIPRAPTTTLLRRFGDCKDMVVLLNSILFALGFEAKPVLVSFDRARHLEQDIPSHAAFDHVISMVKTAGKSYMLDPTTGPQLGSLDRLQQANFGKGVPVQPDGPGVVDVVAPLPDWHRRTVDVYDVRDGDTAKFSTNVVFRMSAADRIYTWHETDGITELEDAYLEFYRKQFPGIEKDGPFEFSVDEDLAQVTISAKYRIPDPFGVAGDEGDDEDDTHVFYFWADDISSSIEASDQTERNDPYHVPRYPLKITQSKTLIAAEEFEFSPWSEEINSSALRFEHRGRVSRGNYLQEFELEIRDDWVDAADFDDHMEAVDEIKDLAWTSYTLPEPDPWYIERAESLFTAYFLALVLISGFVVYVDRHSDLEDRKHQIFYPVSMAKFLLLSFASLGIYQSYWAYKNWVWVRDIGKEEVSPFWRMVFIPFTNFNLFWRVATHPPRGASILKPLAPVSAILFFLSAIAWRMFEQIPDGGNGLGLFGVLGIVWMIPYAYEVRWKNEQNIEYVQKKLAVRMGCHCYAHLFSTSIAIGVCEPASR